MKSLILYSRSYCHLCDDMQAALTVLGAGYSYDLKIIDIDTDPHWVALYDELVPVLVECATNGDVREVCHHFLDQRALHATLSSEDNLALERPSI